MTSCKDSIFAGFRSTISNKKMSIDIGTRKLTKGLFTGIQIPNIDT